MLLMAMPISTVQGRACSNPRNCWPMRFGESTQANSLMRRFSAHCPRLDVSAFWFAFALAWCSGPEINADEDKEQNNQQDHEIIYQGREIPLENKRGEEEQHQANAQDREDIQDAQSRRGRRRTRSITYVFDIGIEWLH